MNEVQIKDWLDGNRSQNEIENIIYTDYPENKLQAYPVSKDLFSPKVDSNIENSIIKFEYPELELAI